MFRLVVINAPKVSAQEIRCGASSVGIRSRTRVAQRRNQINERQRQLRQADAAHDVVQPHQQFGVVEIVVQEPFGDKTGDERGDAIDRPVASRLTACCGELRIEFGEGRVVVVEALWVVFGQRPVEEQLDEM